MEFAVSEKTNAISENILRMFINIGLFFEKVIFDGNIQTTMLQNMYSDITRELSKKHVSLHIHFSPFISHPNGENN